ncbi:hypothetical protein [Niveispirillum sp. KHB5.9]|uniref:hypothetical protein n=1 Tax=Niveispirillum sp. KHB5.9 TaxID=3400269 RepID=UPI003A8B25D2
MSNAFTVTIDNPGNLVSGSIALIRSGTEFAISQLARYLDWQGSLDVQVRIRSADDPQHPYPNVDGILPANPGVTFDTAGTGSLVTLAEARTGVDPNGATADTVFTIYLGRDGTIRNYGFPVWLDPNPRADTTPALPAGQHDFVSIATHEILHGLGFYYWPAAKVEFTRQLTNVNGVNYFTGDAVKALLGPQGLPLANQSDHYGNSNIDYQPVTRGIMYQFGNYELNRWEIGRLDLAVLKDLGWTVKSTAGLPLVDLDDRQPNVTGTAATDRVYGDFRGNVLTGLAGNDLFDGGLGNDTMSGGTGLDVALFTGGTASIAADGTAIVTGPDSIDRTDGVEVLILGSRTIFTHAVSRTLLSNPVDEKIYLAANPDVAAAVTAGAFTSGAAHWAAYGKAEGRSPSAFFDADYYAGHNPDLAAAFGSNDAALLDHWLRLGMSEGRAASPFFNPQAYLTLNPDVAAAGVNPVLHYLAYGIAENRAIGADLSWFG